MHELQILHIGQPATIRQFDLGRLELYQVGPMLIGRAIYEPGWRWSEHVRRTAGTDVCEVAHVGLVLSGSAAVLMSDGTEFLITEGDFFSIPAGHDSWVVGEDEYVSLHLLGAESYATQTEAASTDSDLG